MYEIEGGIQIFELVKTKGCDMDRMDIPPFTTMQIHYHKTFDEIFYVLDGKGVAESNGETFEIEKGGSFVVNRGEFHAVSTRGEALSVLTICLPHFDLRDIFYDKC